MDKTIAKGKKKREKATLESQYPKSIETFRHVGSWELNRLRQDAPDVFNSIVSVRKYRVTVELIDEPIEVIQERLRKLWAECDNYHNWEPLKAEARRYGIDLVLDDVGKGRKA